MSLGQIQIISAISGWVLFLFTLLLKSFSSGVKIGELTKRLSVVEEELKEIKKQMDKWETNNPLPRPCPEFIELRSDYKHTQEKYIEDTRSMSEDIATIKAIVQRIEMNGKNK